LDSWNLEHLEQHRLGSRSQPTSTSAAFGNSLTLGLEQALGIIGDETLGGAGAFAMTVGTGASDIVIGNLTVNSNSQLYLSGGSISANNLLVNGNGILNGQQAR